MYLHLVVEDSGIGIAPEQLARMFEPFVQGDFDPNRRVEGAGLGLSITRRLADAMGGDIRVESTVGEGTVFEVSLPSRALEAPASQPTPKASRNLASLPPLTILVVDDMSLNRDLLRAILGDSRHRVFEAEDGQQALQVAAESVPDVVLMDIRMPVMDGHTAMKQMRADPRFDTTHIIAVTASSLSTQERVLRHEFDGYVRKPFTQEDVIGEIVRVIGADATEESETEVGPPPPDPEVIADPAAAARARAALIELADVRWQGLVKSFAMRDIGEFANQVEQLAGEAGLNRLATYARRLKQAVELFDVVNAESLLARYPELLKDLDINAQSPDPS
jgi:CheY-like chemotaxis protein